MVFSSSSSPFFSFIFMLCIGSDQSNVYLCIRCLNKRNITIILRLADVCAQEESKKKMKIHLAAGFLSLYMLDMVSEWVSEWREKRSSQIIWPQLPFKCWLVMRMRAFRGMSFVYLMMRYFRCFSSLQQQRFKGGRCWEREGENGSVRSLPFQFQRIIESSFFRIIVIICFGDCLWGKKNTQHNETKLASVYALNFV